ncbi:MAG: hypothetical protein ACRCVU_12700 [Flavobacterium sp.]
MKKILSLFAITAFLMTSCSSDDNTPIRPEIKDQTEVGKESPIVGEYSFNHAGNPIPFHFEKNKITMKMTGMAGSGQDDDVFDVITTYKDKAGVLKTVAKSKETNEYKAFFFRDIKDDKSKFMFNMDLTAKTEIEAIKAAYPAKDIVVDHAKGQFGWLEMIKGAIVEPIQLPVNGKYVFAQGTHVYYYNFTNEVVNFNGAYDMTVLAHNKNTNKILLQGKNEEVKNKYYVIQLKNIKDDNVDIARLTFSETTAKADAEKEYASQTEIKANFTTYTKDKGTDSAFANLKGTYGSTIIVDPATKLPLAQYVFKLVDNDEAFLFRADMGKGFGESASFTLKKVDTDEAKGQIIYEVTGSTGYYSGRTGQYLTVYVKDIAKDGSKATFSIATRQLINTETKQLEDTNSVAKSKGDVIGKTIEEAKAIKAPEAEKVWKEDMMKYAHLWMQTTRE